MKKKVIKETDLYTRINILLLDRQKNVLEELKDELSLISNAKIDNSCLIRGIIEFYSKNPSKLTDLKNYMVSQIGGIILERFEDMVASGATDDEIYNEIGIGKDIASDLREKLQ